MTTELYESLSMEQMQNIMSDVVRTAFEKKDVDLKVVLIKVIRYADNHARPALQQRREQQREREARWAAQERNDEMLRSYILSRLRITPKKLLTPLDKFILRFSGPVGPSGDLYVPEPWEPFLPEARDAAEKSAYLEHKRTEKKENRELNKRRKAWDAGYPAREAKRKAEAAQKAKAARASAAHTERKKLAVPTPAPITPPASKVARDMKSALRKITSENDPLQFIINRAIATEKSGEQREAMVKDLGSVIEYLMEQQKKLAGQ
jgi:hypothetical protein